MTTTQPRLRASEIPQMVDVDGHIDEQMLRWGQGVTVRPMFQVIPLDTFERSPEDEYRYVAADAYLPQPPRMLDGWERELHGLPERLSVCPCGCGLALSDLVAAQAPPRSERSALESAMTGLWFVPAIENPAAPTRADLERARGLYAFPRRFIAGMSVRPFTEAIQQVSQQLAALERTRDDLQDAVRVTARFRLDRALFIPAVPLTSFPDRGTPAPDVSPRERALEQRRSRGTGPQQDPFRHRGGRGLGR